jgi:hypothetical protein
MNPMLLNERQGKTCRILPKPICKDDKEPYKSMLELLYPHFQLYPKVMVDIADNQIVIPYAFADSDKIDVGAKGFISADKRDGVLYVRYRKLHALLKIKNGKRNLDVINTKKNFKAYDADKVSQELGK